MGLIVLLAFAIATSLVVHAYMKNFLLASLVAAAVTSFAFCIVAQAISPDPLIAIAFVFGTMISFPVALVIGAFFYTARVRNLEAAEDSEDT